MSIEEQVLARVKPSPEDEAHIRDVVKKLTDKVLSTEAAKEILIEPFLVGSIAKGTHLKDPDADLFLLFDPDVPRETLERIGLAIGRQAIGGREHYAEHPYIKGEFMGLRTDIVPAYKIVDSSQKMTAVDRTPFHTEYVQANLKQELRDDVRLLKAFMKGIGTYGADAKTMGFSGYLCELLIIKFGGFRRLLTEAVEWKGRLRFELGEATDRKFDAPMTFIDPVDATRNVSCAVSEDCLATFIAAARDYLESPTMEFYFPHPLESMSFETINERIGERGGIITINMPAPDLIDDILYPQLRKFERNAAQHLANVGFKPIDTSSSVHGGRMVIIIELESLTLPHGMLHKGPPVTVNENSKNFLAKWEGNESAMSAPFIMDGCWHVFARRKYTEASEALRQGLEAMDAGKDLNRQKGEMVISGEITDSTEVREAFSNYLDRRMPWSR